MGFTDYQKYRRASVAVIAAILCAGMQTAISEPGRDGDTADVQIGAGEAGGRKGVRESELRQWAIAPSFPEIASRLHGVLEIAIEIGVEKPF